MSSDDLRHRILLVNNDMSAMYYAKGGDKKIGDYLKATCLLLPDPPASGRLDDVGILLPPAEQTIFNNLRKTRTPFEIINDKRPNSETAKNEISTVELIRYFILFFIFAILY